jgi:hypothetical protein
MSQGEARLRGYAASCTPETVFGRLVDLTPSARSPAVAAKRPRFAVRAGCAAGVVGGLDGSE